MPRARLLLGLLGLGAPGCGADSGEATRVELPVVTDDAALEDVTTDLGYSVHLTRARLAIADLQFAIAGEVHEASLWRRLERALLPRAHAHPGHYQGGEVTGELLGRFIADWTAPGGAALADGMLITGTYDSANFTLIRASAAEGLDAQDPLIDHTSLLEGTATRDGTTRSFRASIDSPTDRQIVGVPFEAEVRSPAHQVIALALLPRDPYEQDTLFDGLDFFALPEADGVVVLSEAATDPALIAAYDLLRRTLQTHDHFRVEAREMEPTP